MDSMSIGRLVSYDSCFNSFGMPIYVFIFQKYVIFRKFKAFELTKHTVLINPTKKELSKREDLVMNFPWGYSMDVSNVLYLHII